MSTTTSDARPKIIPVKTSDGKLYPVVIGRKLSVEKYIDNRSAVVFFDRRLAPPNIRRALIHALPSGESAKSFGSYRDVIDSLIIADQGRPLIAVAYGGGTVGDLIGFAASTYRRGIPFLQVPTTLLAMVDASVGGKTAINHPLAKNMIGTFYQPIAVVADLNRLQTLPIRQLRSGTAEIVKHGLIADDALFARIEKSPTELLRWDSQMLTEAIKRSVEIKASVVARDVHETKGVREFLNFGHTVGHAIEAVHHYRGITHGEGVAIGMIAAGLMSEEECGFQETPRIAAMLEALKLPTRLRGESARKLILASRRDKKRRGAKLRMTLLTRLGRASVVDGIEEKRLDRILRRIGASA